MPSPEFIAGLLVLGLTFAGALALANLIGIDPTWTLIGLAALAWALFALWERRLTKRAEQPEIQPIRVDWEDKLTATDFAADGDTTARDLQDRGLTPKTAIGQDFVFATGHSGSDGDIWFEGTFVSENGRIIIRAAEPV